MSASHSPPVFRFAPSPNGLLHLGHAYSALLNFDMSKRFGGRFLLRMEDIDTIRCTSEFEVSMLEDLEWLGIEWEEPLRRQSDHFDVYAEALAALSDKGLVFQSNLSRGALKRVVADLDLGDSAWPRDPDGSPLYPGQGFEPPDITPGSAPVHRLDMARTREVVSADLSWTEFDRGGNHEKQIPADPAKWGDVILARRDTPTSYHLSVVVDDALQGVTHIVRGNDLYESTSVHVLLQALLGYKQPVYLHHNLILDDDGKKLSKSRQDTSLRDLRKQGYSALEVRRVVGL